MSSCLLHVTAPGLPERAKAAGTQLLATFYLFSPYYDKDMRRLSREMYSGIIVYNHFLK